MKNVNLRGISSHLATSDSLHTKKDSFRTSMVGTRLGMRESILRKSRGYRFCKCPSGTIRKYPHADCAVWTNLTSWTPRMFAKRFPMHRKQCLGESYQWAFSRSDCSYSGTVYISSGDFERKIAGPSGPFRGSDLELILHHLVGACSIVYVPSPSRTT